MDISEFKENLRDVAAEARMLGTLWRSLRLLTEGGLPEINSAWCLSFYLNAKGENIYGAANEAPVWKMLVFDSKVRVRRCSSSTTFSGYRNVEETIEYLER